MAAMMVVQQASYQNPMGQWHTGSIRESSNIAQSTVRHVGRSLFLELPVEVRLMIYRAFFDDLILYFGTAQELQFMRFRLVQLEEVALLTSSVHVVSLLLLSKRTYKEARSELHKIAQVHITAKDVLEMSAISPLDLGRLSRFRSRGFNPQLIRRLTLHSSWILSPANDREVKMNRTGHLRKTVEMVKSSLPRLEEFEVWVERFRDLIAGGSVPRFVSPLCCFHQLRKVKFVAQDVAERSMIKAGGGVVRDASRLRVEVAVLRALGDLLTRSYHPELTSDRLHQDGKCLYTGPGSGTRLLMDKLARVLKEDYRVKVPKLNRDAALL